MQDNNNHLDITIGAPQPSGISGWLILPAIGLLISPILLVKGTYDAYAPLMSVKVLSALADTHIPNHNPLLLPVLGVEFLATIALIIFTLIIIPLFFSKKPIVPKLMVIWYACSVAIELFDVIIIPLALPNLGLEQEVRRSLFRNLFVACLWIPYFMKSVRVKNTFGQNAFPKAVTTENVAASQA